MISTADGVGLAIGGPGSEAHQALGYFAERDDIVSDRLGLVGYRMGSFLGLVVAAATDRVRAVGLAAGRDLPDVGHYLPDAAIAHAARWMAMTLSR